MLPSSTHESPRFDASGAADLEVFIRAVRSLVDARLIAFFADKLAEAERVSPQSLELVQALEALTMRGGKRLRPVVVAAAMLGQTPSSHAQARSPRPLSYCRPIFWRMTILWMGTS